MVRCPSIVFAPAGKDYQTTHTQDELYIVHRGHGVLLVEEERFPFVAGDVLFVPAHAMHRFVEFSDDFVTWAVFWGPEVGIATGGGQLSCKGECVLRCRVAGAAGPGLYVRAGWA